MKKKPSATDRAAEDALFETAMRDIRPLPGKRRSGHRLRPAKPDAAALAEAKAAASTTPVPASDLAPAPSATPPRPRPAATSAALPTEAGLDRRSQERLRRGKLKIDGRLDLHGHTQADAHQALNGFIHRAYGSGLRCVLVITGKGGERAGQDDAGIMPSRGKGVLRRQVPLWLGGELGRMVLAVETARPQHGGDGAYYVLLRRRR